MKYLYLFRTSISIFVNAFNGSLGYHQYVDLTCTLVIVFGKMFEFCCSFKSGEKSQQQCSGVKHLNCLSAGSGLSVPVMPESQNLPWQWLAVVSKGGCRKRNSIQQSPVCK